MDKLLTKLNYKGQQRIAVINAGDKFLSALEEGLKGVQVDRAIDQRFPYEFLIIFVQLVSEVEFMAPKALHNLTADGVLWFAYPKKTSKKLSSDIDRDHGWEVLIDRGFDKVRMVAVDEDWSALRFRNVRFIKSAQRRFSQHT
jgi:hypothetical protein